MKFVVFLITLLSSFVSSIDAKELELRIGRETLDSCQFVGEKRCLIVVDSPVLVLFRVGEVISLETTAPDSEVQGVAAYVSDRYFNLKRQLDPVAIEKQPDDFRCSHRAMTKKLCFESGGVTDVLIIVPPGVRFKVISMTFNDRIPGVLVIPTNPVGTVTAE